MYLDNIIEYNPRLIEKTIEFHQQGLIPPNTWVIDLDTIAANAKALSDEAKRLGLATYLMSKQHNRNPYVNAVALAMGLNKIVAVDATCALMTERYRLPLGHVGHLNQIPKTLVPKIVAMHPEVITVYNIEHCQWINTAASQLGIVQDLLVRVTADNDVLFDGQEGGHNLKELPALVESLAKLKNVKLVGVTSFPCLKYNETKDEEITIVKNFYTILEATRELKKLGLAVKQINTPGNTSCHVMSLLKQHGATHIEPGNALLGTTPSNAFRNDLKEKTAFIYLTEISHFFEKRAYAYGGGVFHTAYSDKIEALVGKSWEKACNNRFDYLHEVIQNIDYHMQFKPLNKSYCEIGDSVILAYRTQMHMTRSYVLPISGLSGNRELRVHYLFDNANNGLDKNFMPLNPEKVCEDINHLLTTYQ